MGLQLDIFFNTILCVLGLAAAGFVLSRVIKRVDIVDSIWGLGFLLIALINSPTFSELNLTAVILLVIVGVWSIRLSGYLTFRNLQKPEDKRYVKMIERWGKPKALHIFFKVFLLQSFLIGIISYPISLVVRTNPSFLTPWTFLGVSLFIIGFIFEVSGDWELYRFKKNNSKGVCSTGVWSLTRHPNYFGEILMSWSYFFIALSLPQGLYSVFSPVILTFLIVKVSGVSMLESIMEEKGEEFKKYAAKVPTLIPLTKHRTIVLFKITITTLFLDFLWLGVFLKSFYVEQAAAVARLTGSGFDTIFWAAGFVYVLIPLGVGFFAVSNSSSRAYAFFKGALFGFVLYGVYDFTNIALIKNWPLEMSLVDLLWGPILCGLSAMVGYKPNHSKNL